MPANEPIKRRRKSAKATIAGDLPVDLRTYGEQFIYLCHKCSGLPGVDVERISLFVAANFLVEQFAVFSGAESLPKRLRAAILIQGQCLKLKASDDPVVCELGQIGETLAVGLRSFVRPHMNMASEKTLRAVFSDKGLAKHFTQLFTTLASAPPEQQDEFRFMHDHVMHGSREMIQAIRDRNFKKAQEVAKRCIGACMINANKFPIAFKAHGFFAIAEFLLDSRIQGRLFTSAKPDLRTR